MSTRQRPHVQFRSEGGQMRIGGDRAGHWQVGRGFALGEYLRRFWLPALLSSEVAEPDGPPVRVPLLGERLVAFRDTSGAVGLLEAGCPHRRANLYWGRNEEGGIRCVYHGWKFSVSGQCLEQPAEPETSRFKERVRAVAYETYEAAGVVWAYLGPPEAKPVFPAFECTAIDTSKVSATKGVADRGFVDCLAARLAEGVRDRQEWSPGLGSEADGTSRSLQIEVASTALGLLAMRASTAERSSRGVITPLLLPVFTIDAPNAVGTMALCADVPVDDRHTWQFSIEWNPDRFLRPDERAQAGRERVRVDGVGFRPVAVREGGSGHEAEPEPRSLPIVDELRAGVDASSQDPATRPVHAVATAIGQVLAAQADALRTGAEVSASPESYRVRAVVVEDPSAKDSIVGLFERAQAQFATGASWPHRGGAH